MSLTKRTRFILVRSTRNANATEDNIEPYHISIFRRSSSMPPLPKRSSTTKPNFLRRDQRQQSTESSTMVTNRYQQRDKDEISTNKFYKLNIQTMKKKSARISMRLSNAFGLSAHTVDEHFNYQEQRFRAMEKFLKVFLRNVHIDIEALRESILTQVDVAEDLEELLDDKIPDLFQQFIRSKRYLLENIFHAFRNHIELYVINSIDMLLKLFIPPSNLIAKRNNKLLDYDSAQSAYEKVKDQQLKQAKQVLDLSKHTYETLNNQLLEELPILYETSCEILSLATKEYIRAYYRLMQHMNTNIQLVLNKTIPLVTSEHLTWQNILERYLTKNDAVGEQIFQLTITAKNFSERVKSLSTSRVGSGVANTYNCDKETYIQTDEIRQSMKNRYPEKDLFVVIQDHIGYSNNQSTMSRTEFTVQNGDLVSVVQRYDEDQPWLVDNGILQGYLPRCVLVPLVTNAQPDSRSIPPPIPVRHDLRTATRAPLPLPRTNVRTKTIQPRSSLSRDNTGSEPCLINSAHYVEEVNEQLYLNQVQARFSTSVITSDCHHYASIDLEDSTTEQSNTDEQIYIALYDFNSTSNGVLSLCIGERLRMLQRFDGDGNEEWWFVEKINETKDKGYVPANYIRAA
ncbi:unnamed protein product [Adineta ricciae]|uniref:SH3 domain-containing protein n=1 Tax=Adineta ricciae TaxID=249248 RepID=A0A815MVJ8_ADIRI|nr:unnamed protein product [Adineta ricciae]CAF1591073.1 unnamed protein product [Adineta ricciae]